MAREAEKIAPRCNGYILGSLNRISHRRSVHFLARVEVPQWPAASRHDPLERPSIIAEENQTAGRRHGAAPGSSVPRLRISPHDLSFRYGERQQNLLSFLVGRHLCPSVVVGLAALERCRAGEEKIATLKRHHIEKFGLRIVRRRKPVRRPIQAWTNVGALLGWYSARKYGTPL